MIAVATDDPRFYYRTVKELKKRKRPFKSLSREEAIPAGVRAVITTPWEAGLIHFHTVVAEEDPKTAVDKALWAAKRADGRYKDLVVALDPGAAPGMAVLSRNTVLLAQELSRPEDIKAELDHIIDVFGRPGLIKCGHGGGIYRNRILKILQENYDIPIQVVDERRTTPVVTGGVSPDIIAAINIGLKGGKVLKKKVEVSPKDGETRKVQDQSRAVSGNITISKALAGRVARGEMSLEEAISLQKARQ